MLLFKPKPKFDEILPPPPPPDMEFEKDKPKFFDKIIKPKKIETLPEEREFSGLMKEFGKGPKPKKVAKILKRGKISKKRIIPKKELKQLKKTTQTKKIKEKISAIKGTTIKKIEKRLLPKISKEVKKPKPEPPEVENFGLEKPDFELPEGQIGKELDLEVPELGPSKDIELPETLEELDIGDLGNIEQEIKFKPKEILEAEEEIKNAIDRIKEWNASERTRSQLPEKPSVFRKLFAKREKLEEKPKEEHLFPEIPESNNISAIQNSINKAREALMKFDLETAKKNYIEIMKIYNILKAEEQAKVYRDIRDLYFERKSAEELRV